MKCETKKCGWLALSGYDICLTFKWALLTEIKLETDFQQEFVPFVERAPNSSLLDRFCQDVSAVLYILENACSCLFWADALIDYLELYLQRCSQQVSSWYLSMMLDCSMKARFYEGSMKAKYICVAWGYASLRSNQQTFLITHRRKNVTRWGLQSTTDGNADPRRPISPAQDLQKVTPQSTSAGTEQ